MGLRKKKKLISLISGCFYFNLILDQIRDAGSKEVVRKEFKGRKLSENFVYDMAAKRKHQH